MQCRHASKTTVGNICALFKQVFDRIDMASARGQRGSVLNNEDPLGRQPGRTKQWMRAAKREIKSMAGECLRLHHLHH